MKTIISYITTVMIAGCFTSCTGQSGFGEQSKTVRAYSREMNNMEMLSMEQMSGWQLLAGTQWIGNSYCNSIKGVNEKLNANFFVDSNRNYTQSSIGRSGTTDGKMVFLKLMPAPDYLDYVFHRQFPNVKNAKRTMLKTLDMYSDAERAQLEEVRKMMYDANVQFNRQSAGGAYTHVRKQTIDRAAVEYKWEQDGDTIIHFMETVIHATYMDFRSQYLNSSSISWSQGALITATTPAKNSKKVKTDVEQMCASIVWNEQYINALNQIIQQGMQRNDAEVRRIQNEMAQAEIRHQQNMARTIQETNDYIAKTTSEVYANRQASMQRINQGWRDAIIGVDRYVGVDGKVQEVPVSMGSKVWQSADAGTIYTSDSYLFSPVDNLLDKNGNLQEFRQLQLLK